MINSYFDVPGFHSHECSYNKSSVQSTNSQTGYKQTTWNTGPIGPACNEEIDNQSNAKCGQCECTYSEGKQP